MARRAAGVRSPLVRDAWVLYLCLGGLLLACYYLVPAVKGNGLLFNAVGLSSAVAIIVGVRRHRPPSKAAWYLFAVGQIFFVTGDAFYYGYDALFGHDVPFPSLGDVFYLSVYPALIAGLLIVIRRRTPGGNRNGLIDALIVTVGLALLSWVFLMAPYAHDSTLTFLEKLVSIAYPMMDVCLLAVAIRLAVEGGLSKPSLRLLVLSILALLTTDAILGLLTLNGGYQEGGLLDIGWALYYLLWGAAALHPSMRELEEPVPSPQHKLTWGRLLLLTLASLMTAVVRTIQMLRGEATDEPVLLVASVALHLLVVARMVGLVRDAARAAARERGLREAARDLVAATGRDEVLDAALRSLEALVGGRQEVRVAVLRPSGELQARAIDAEGPLQWTVKASDVTTLDAEALRSSGTLEVTVSGSRLPEALRLAEDSVHALAFPLFVREQLRGLVFVAGEEEFSSELRDALQTLSVQIALALESAILAEEVHTRRSEKRFRSLVQHSSDLIAVVEADTSIKYVSPSVQRVLGYEVEELAGRRFSELMYPQDRDSALTLVTDRLDGGIVQGDVVECRLRHANGTWLYFEILHTNLLQDPNVEGIVLNARDVSERKSFESQLRHQAFHDPVTNLANRALFTDRVEHALARMTRDAGGIALLFIDLDDFKVINDSLGHAAGDAVLAEIGQKLKRCVRPMDTVARFGGDEFSVLLEDVERLDEVADIADRILEVLDEPVRVDEKEVFIGASIGIATLDSEDALTSAADELMRNADVAMYMAKREGKRQYRVFEPEMHASVLDRLELKGALQRAIERGELELHYQPIVSLAEQSVNALEALVRWRHPERGLIPPGEFIPVAEESGLIGALGRWVLKEACKQARFLQDLFPSSPRLTMSVNLSVKQLSQAGLIEEVAGAIADSGIDPSTLVLEITESVLVSDRDTTIERLNDLKRLGVRLAVDDFGTGYSSLSYLSRFPVDALKIDRSFVNQLGRGTESSALAAAIVRIGETLNLHTVAEGIETPDQLEVLQGLGCSFGQGFLFARPMSLDGTVEFLAAKFAAAGASG
ncbi:MAG: putative bifunctional diguanylate cyclase/phosphodiesterase [Actinomycetota bacterium]